MTQQGTDLIRRFFENASPENLGSWAEICTEDYQHHDPQLPVADVRSLAQYLEVMGGFFRAFPDIKVDILDVFEAGDRVAARWTFSGTNTGPLGEMPATNKTVTVQSMIISRVRDGKLAESWVVDDAMGMMQQLGVVPSP